MVSKPASNAGMPCADDEVKGSSVTPRGFFGGINFGSRQKSQLGTLHGIHTQAAKSTGLSSYTVGDYRGYISMSMIPGDVIQTRRRLQTATTLGPGNTFQYCYWLP